MRRIQSEGIEIPSSQPLDVESPQDWFHAGQLEAWGSDEDDVLIVAGSQGGKTAIEPYWQLREIKRSFSLASQIGRGEHLLIGPTLSLLEQQAIPTYRTYLEAELGVAEFIGGKKPLFRFTQKGLMRLFGTDKYPVNIRCAYANDSSNLESITALSAVWDETGQKENKVESYEACDRRLLAARSQGFGRRLFGTTPYEWNWFKDRVYDRAIAGAPGMSLHNFVSWMNPIVSEDACRKRLLEGMPIWKWEMMYLGRYTRPSGAIYDCLDRQRHGIDRFPIPAAWPKYPGVDFGPNNTGAVLFAEELSRERGPNGPVWGKKTGRYVLYRSYKPGMSRSADQHVASIRSGESLLLGAGGANTEDGWRQAFAAAGMPLANPPNIGVEAQIANVYRWLVDGKLIIFNDLREVWDELESYSREMGSDGEPTEKIDDKSKFHLCDAIRYLCAHLDPPKQSFKSSKGRPGRWA